MCDKAATGGGAGRKRATSSTTQPHRGVRNTRNTPVLRYPAARDRVTRRNGRYGSLRRRYPSFRLRVRDPSTLFDCRANARETSTHQPTISPKPLRHRKQPPPSIPQQTSPHEQSSYQWASSVFPHLGVVDERLAIARAGGQGARAGVLEALDDRGLAAAVGPDDHRQRGVELDNLFAAVRQHQRGRTVGYQASLF